jgi:hypothetical protein
MACNLLLSKHSEWKINKLSTYDHLQRAPTLCVDKCGDVCIAVVWTNWRSSAICDTGSFLWRPGVRNSLYVCDLFRACFLYCASKCITDGLQYLLRCACDLRDKKNFVLGILHFGIYEYMWQCLIKYLLICWFSVVRCPMFSVLKIFRYFF